MIPARLPRHLPLAMSRGVCVCVRLVASGSGLNAKKALLWLYPPPQNGATALSTETMHPHFCLFPPTPCGGWVGVADGK